MLTCKQVSKALAEQDYREMPILKRFALRLHVGICVVCKQYNRNVMLFQDMARAFRKYEDSPSTLSSPSSAKEKWVHSIQAATHEDQSS